MRIRSQLDYVDRQRGRKFGSWRRGGPGLYQSYRFAPRHEFTFVASVAAHNRVDHLVGEGVKDFEGLVEFRTDEDFVRTIVAAGAVPALADRVLAAAYAFRPAASDSPLGLF